MMLICGGVTLVLALLGAPLFTVIAANALVAFYASPGMSLSNMGIQIYRLANQPMLISIPLFTFAGCVLGQSNAPKRLVSLSRALLGWLPGGLAIVALLACTLFTAFTGATGVTIVALGGLLYPALKSDKYSENFSLGLVTTSGSLGLLFPPSLPLILFGVVAGTSIDSLFRAGVLPGVLMIVLLAAYGMFAGRRLEVNPETRTWRALFAAVWKTKWELPLPFVVLGAIYSGRLAISDAAAVTALYVLVVEVFLYRDVSLSALTKVLRQTAVLVGGIMVIMGVALGYTDYLVTAEVPNKVLDRMQGATLLAQSHVADWKALCSKIIAEGERDEPSPGKRIWELLPTEAQEAAQKAAAGATLDPDEAEELLWGLNDLLEDPEFHQPEHFAKTVLPVRTADVLKTDPESRSERQTQRANRVLLEMAYPAEIPSSPLTDLLSSKIVFLVLLNLFLLVVGCMMDIFSALFVVVPLILPIALQYGVDPIHLGIIFLTNLQIGYCTPPVGLNLFIASYRLEKPVVRLYISTLPFLAILLLALIIITYVPSLSLLLTGATEAANGLTP